MCDVGVSDKYNMWGPSNGSIGGGIPLPIASSKESLESIDHTRRGPAQDVLFSLIIWYISKTIPNL